MQHFAGALAQGQYEARIRTNKRDEIGMLYGSMDILAQRLEEARQKDELLKQQQQTFFATVSHELKTPVTVIRGSVEALRDGVISSPCLLYTSWRKSDRWQMRRRRPRGQES